MEEESLSNHGFWQLCQTGSHLKGRIQENYDKVVQLLLEHPKIDVNKVDDRATWLMETAPFVML